MVGTYTGMLVVTSPSNYQHTHVCSDHFIGGSPSSLWDTTNPDWVPSVSLGYTSTSTASVDARYLRAKARASKRWRVEVDGVEEDGVETSNNDVGEIEKYDVCDELEREIVDNGSKDIKRMK